MISRRESETRGGGDYGWLKTRHTFSFGDYYDPAHRGFHSLRVVNEDWILPGTGFELHPHENMEIITLVLAGTLQHQDNLGNKIDIQAGEIQQMTAGTGILHSEVNPSKQETTHLYQLWILPQQKNLTPRYQQQKIPLLQKSLAWILLASRDSKDHLVHIHQDAMLWLGILTKGKTLSYLLSLERVGWIQVITGKLLLNRCALKAGDGAAIEQETPLTFFAESNSSFLLFDLTQS